MFVDLHGTLLYEDNSVNMPLIAALIAARRRGVLVCLWTGGTFKEALRGAKLLAKHGLEFDEIFCNILKGTIIIDNTAYSPDEGGRHE